MPAAAFRPSRNSVGRTQKDGRADMTPAIATERKVTTRPPGSWKMPAANGPQKETAQRHEVGDRADPADRPGAEPEPLDDQRHPQLEAVEPGRQPEVDQGQADHLPADERAQDLPQAVALRGVGLLAAQPLDQPVALL